MSARAPSTQNQCDYSLKCLELLWNRRCTDINCKIVNEMKTCHFFYLILSAVGLFDSVDGTVSEGWFGYNSTDCIICDSNNIQE